MALRNGSISYEVTVFEKATDAFVVKIADVPFNPRLHADLWNHPGDPDMIGGEYSVSEAQAALLRALISVGQRHYIDPNAYSIFIGAVQCRSL